MIGTGKNKVLGIAKSLYLKGINTRTSKTITNLDVAL